MPSVLVELLRQRKYTELNELCLKKRGIFSISEMMIFHESCMAKKDAGAIAKIIGMISELGSKSHDPGVINIVIKLLIDIVIQQGTTAMENPSNTIKKLINLTEVKLQKNAELIRILEKSILASMYNNAKEYVNVQRSINDYARKMDNKEIDERQMEIKYYSNFFQRSVNYVLSNNELEDKSVLLRFLEENLLRSLSHLGNIERIVLISVEENYFFIFLPRIMEMAKKNKRVTVIIALILYGQAQYIDLKAGRNSEFENLIIVKIRNVKSGNKNKDQTQACCLKYMIGPILMKEYTSHILYLDADLDLHNYSLELMYEKMVIDSEWLGDKLIQTFRGNVFCIHSSISAGFLFANHRQVDLYSYISKYIDNSLHQGYWSWGLDPAAIVIGAAKYGMNFISMPCLGTITSDSDLWYVTDEEQKLKSANRAF